MKRIYLDHAAATPVDARVIKAMAPYSVQHFANPSALHKEGVLARTAVEAARKHIATLIGAHADEIIFTGSATESANLAIVGAVTVWQREHRGRVPHVIVSPLEHEAVLEPLRALREGGVRVEMLKVNTDGNIDLKQLYSLITEDTVLVALMCANNEIGTITPMHDVAKTLRKWRKEHRGVVRSKRIEHASRYPLLYTDASQAPNYLEIAVPTLGIDLMTLSSPKIYGPKGAGLLYVARGTALTGMMYGGGQEKGLRAGTENVSAIVGFAKALELAIQLRSKESARLTKLQTAVWKELARAFPDMVQNGSLEKRLPNNINFSLPNVDHEFLALALDARGIAVSTKSACTETDTDVSHVLLALRNNASDKRPASGIRVTMGRGTTSAEMKQFVQVLVGIANTMLRPM